MSVRPIVPDHDSGVTLAKAGEILGISVDTVRRIIAAGRLEAWRIHAGNGQARDIRVSLASIREYRAHYAVADCGAELALAGRRPAAKRVRRNAAHAEALRFVESYGKRGA